jgi:hypothetical protein
VGADLQDCVSAAPTRPMSWNSLGPHVPVKAGRGKTAAATQQKVVDELKAVDDEFSSPKLPSKSYEFKQHGHEGAAAKVHDADEAHRGGRGKGRRTAMYAATATAAMLAVASTLRAFTDRKVHGGLACRECAGHDVHGGRSVQKGADHEC